MAGHGSDVSPGVHEASGARRRPLVIALVITASFMVVEVVGGLLKGSLALLADAGHMATDVAALALALVASWLAGRPATPQYSFGYRRTAVLAAFVNAASLLAISVCVFWEAFQRLGNPPEVDSERPDVRHRGRRTARHRRLGGGGAGPLRRSRARSQHHGGPSCTSSAMPWDRSGRSSRRSSGFGTWPTLCSRPASGS